MTTPQGAQPTKPWYKKVWIWVIIIVAVAVVSTISNLVF
jgi:hypothetical protein